MPLSDKYSSWNYKAAFHLSVQKKEATGKYAITYFPVASFYLKSFTGSALSSQ